MNTRPILGYWIEDAVDVYFVRGPQDAKEEHKDLWTTPLEGVAITPVYQYKDIAQWVIFKHTARQFVMYSRWTPESPYPLEHDHTGKIAFEVLDFAETEEEAIHITNHFKNQTRRK